MWKSVVGHNVNVKVAGEGDDWETDPDFEVLNTSWIKPPNHQTCHYFKSFIRVSQNDVSEQEQRWGAKTIEGSGRKEHIRCDDKNVFFKRSNETNRMKIKAGLSGCCAAAGRGSSSRTLSGSELFLIWVMMMMTFTERFKPTTLSQNGY